MTFIAQVGIWCLSAGVWSVVFYVLDTYLSPRNAYGTVQFAVICLTAFIVSYVMERKEGEQ